MRRRKSVPIALLVGIPALSVGLALFVSATASPYQIAANLQEDNASLRKSIKGMKQANQRLERDIQAVKSGVELESEARRRGWRRPEEVPLILPQPNPKTRE